jgi:hypothetical protein
MRYTPSLPSAYKRQPAADNTGAAKPAGLAKLEGVEKYPRLVFIWSGLGTIPASGGCRRFIEPVSPRLFIKTILLSAGGWCAKGSSTFLKKASKTFIFASWLLFASLMQVDHKQIKGPLLEQLFLPVNSLQAKIMARVLTDFKS